MTVLITEVQAERPLVKNVDSLDQTIDVNLSIRGTLVGHSSNPLKRIKLNHSIKRILDATYEKADLEKLKSECKH